LSFKLSFDDSDCADYIYMSMYVWDVAFGLLTNKCILYILILVIAILFNDSVINEYFITSEGRKTTQRYAILQKKNHVITSTLKL